MAKKRASRISFSTPFFILFCSLLFVATYLKFSTFLPAKLLVGSGIVACVVFLIWWVQSSFQLSLSSDKQPTNATLTCKNGHTGRVLVNMGGWRARRGGQDVSEITYYIDGHEVKKSPKIDPERCPECGAEWQVPKKRGHRNR